MTPDDTLERHLAEGMVTLAGSGAPDYLDDVLRRSNRTRQRRAWLPLQRSVFPARTPYERAGWMTGRSLSIIPILRIATVVTLLAVTVGVAVGPLRPSTPFGATDPTPSTSPGPAPLRSGPLPAGAYVTTPFTQPGSDACFVPPQASCIDDTDDDAIRVTLTVPDGWSGTGPEGGDLSSAGVALLLLRGASIAADPCRNDGTDVIPVGPSVRNFVSALDGHPRLSVTEPISTTLDGHAGTYMELQVPDEPTIQGESEPASLEGCPVYRPWNPWYLAQTPGELWRLWILDVDGVRVVIQAIERTYAAADVKAELQGIVDSLRIELPVAPARSPLPASLTWSPASLEQDWPAPVRDEPVGKPVLVSLMGGSELMVYDDPVGDIGSSARSWIDITKVDMHSGRQAKIDLAGAIPSPVPGPAEAWIAYGLVVDTDRDGVADVRLGIDNLPAGGGHRAWRTDLHTGRTEFAAGAPYGYVGGRYLDTFYHGDGGPLFSGDAEWSRFYAWASVIEDGRVVATDYAPDAGWLD